MNSVNLFQHITASICGGIYARSRYVCYTRNSSRMRYSERELYDDVVYALYEIKKREENNKHTAT